MTANFLFCGPRLIHREQALRDDLLARCVFSEEAADLMDRIQDPALPVGLLYCPVEEPQLLR